MNTSSLNEKFIAYFALISALAISAVAIFYSVSGLIAIYPMALIPIIVMGVSIEVGKLSMTLWLKQNWECPWVYKLTMIPAVLILMVITSGGVFGFLSKAHSDQSLISGDAVSKVQLIEDRISTVKDNIATQRENISAARTSLSQLDSQVNARLDRGTDEVGAERAVQIRRNQRTERAALNREITDAQNEIQKLNTQLAALNQEKAPLAGELRKVEAEVGPVKYIAALIYGDNPDANLLERAVRWVTLMIVIVLDPVAILLLLASQYSFQRIRERNNPPPALVEDKTKKDEEEIEEDKTEEDSVDQPVSENTITTDTVSVIIVEPVVAVAETNFTAAVRIEEPITLTVPNVVPETAEIEIQPPQELVAVVEEVVVKTQEQIILPQEEIIEEIKEEPPVEETVVEPEPIVESVVEQIIEPVVENTIVEKEQLDVILDEQPVMVFITDEIKIEKTEEIEYQPDSVSPIVEDSVIEDIAVEQNVIEPISAEAQVVEDIAYSTSDTQTADSEIKADLAPTEYIQNEEQKDSNLWSNTSLKSITQEEYLDKVRKLKGVE